MTIDSKFKNKRPKQKCNKTKMKEDNRVNKVKDKVKDKDKKKINRINNRRNR